MKYVLTGDTLSLGRFQRRTFSLPLPGREPVQVDVRPLTHLEEHEVVEQARRMAQARGVPDPKPGEPLYELALMACVVLRGVIDHDSPQDRPEPFFDTVEQVMGLDRDRVVYLYEAQTGWQDLCSPRQTTLTFEQYIGLVDHLASSEEGDLGDPFSNLPRSTLIACARSMARALRLSPGLSSLGSLGSGSGPTSGSATSATGEASSDLAPPTTTPTTDLPLSRPARRKAKEAVGKKGRRR